MKPEGHLEKAKAFEDRASKWESERDAPSVIEGIFDAFVHYVAYGINMKFGTDIDGHTLQKRFLRSRGVISVLHAYEEIERIRIGSVYGSKWNGKRIQEALGLLVVVKNWIKIHGK